MKVGVIGAGAVGSACLISLILRGTAREIVVLDTNQKRAQAVATDLQYGAALSRNTDIYAGDYDDLNDAAVVLITAGVNEKTGGATNRDDPTGRLKLLGTNAQIYRQIIPQLTAASPWAVIVVVTDPPDPLADITRQMAGHDRVVSAGTYLDTLRFRFHLGKYLDVNPSYIDAQVVGEHGTSQVLLWSSVNVCGVPLATIAGKSDASLRQQIVDDVKFANITIIEGNNASQYGIGIVSARITEFILRNEMAVIPIGSYQEKYGVTLSLPSVVGEHGVLRRFEPSMTSEENEALEVSALRLKEALSSIQ